MTKLEPRTWKHTILQGDDEARLRELRERAESLRPSQPRHEIGDSALLSDDNPWDAYDAACAEADEFAESAEGRGVTLTLRTVGRKRWRELVGANPPREGDEGDLKAGINRHEFLEDLVPACIAGPNLGEGEMADLLDAITPAEFDLLGAAAWNLHKNVGLDPKERMLSAPTLT